MVVAVSSGRRVVRSNVHRAGKIPILLSQSWTVRNGWHDHSGAIIGFASSGTGLCTKSRNKRQHSPPQLSRGGAAKREPDRAKPQLERRGGVGQGIDFLERTAPPLLFVAAFNSSRLRRSQAAPYAAPRLNQGGELLHLVIFCAKLRHRRFE